MGYTDVDFTGAKKILDCGGMLIDTREETEFVMEHAEEAELFPVDEINEETAAEIIPDKETALVLYCRTGSRAALAAQRLYEIGYKNVYNLGSIVGWPYGITHGL